MFLAARDTKKKENNSRCIFYLLKHSENIAFSKKQKKKKALSVAAPHLIFYLLFLFVLAKMCNQREYMCNIKGKVHIRENLTYLNI